MNRNIQSPTKSLSSPSWTSFVTSNNSGFNVIPATNNNGTLNASIINMSGTQQSPLQQQSFTATIHTTGAAQNQINSNRYVLELFFSLFLLLLFVCTCACVFQVDLSIQSVLPSTLSLSLSLSLL